MPSILFNTGVGVATLTVALVVHFLRYFLFPTLPANIARVGDDNAEGRLSLKTRWRWYVDSETLYQEVYEQYSKAGRTCIVPGLGLDEVVILPNSSLQWWGRQSGDVLSLPMALARIFKSKYTSQSESYQLHPWLPTMLKQRMAQFVKETTKVMQTKMRYVFDMHIGGQEGELKWRTMGLHSTMRMIATHLACCFSAVDEPTLEEPQYVQDCYNAPEMVITCGGILGLFPSFLQPIVSSIICLPLRRIERRTRNILGPILERRLALLRKGDGDKMQVADMDRLQMSLQYGERHGPHELNARDFTGRWMTGNMALIDMTSHALSNFLLNILATDNKYNTIEILRTEMSEVLAEHEGRWNKTAVAQMVKTDSVIRETLRLHNVPGRSLRVVSAVGGITTDDNVHLPQGTVVSMLTRAPHLDPENYKDPYIFDPFRFSRDTTAPAGGNSLLALSGTHMAFGFGSHACPGRFLVDVELKIIVAYLLLHYDVRLAEGHKGVRPKNVYRCEAMFAPRSAKIELKRRKCVEQWYDTVA